MLDFDTCVKHAEPWEEELAKHDSQAQLPLGGDQIRFRDP